MKKHKGLIAGAAVILLLSQILLGVFSSRPASEVVLDDSPQESGQEAEQAVEEQADMAEAAGGEAETASDLPDREISDLAAQYPPYGLAGIFPGEGNGLIFEEMDAQVAERIVESVFASAETEPETEQTEPETSAYENRVVITASGYLNIREENDPESRVIGKIYHGTSADLLEQGESFSRISSGAVTGWVSNEYILTGAEAEAYAQEQGSVTIATVTAEWLNVRESPSTEADVIATVEAGQWFIVTDQGGGWVRIDYTSGMEGFLNAEFVTVSQNYGQAISIDAEQELLELAESRAALEEEEEETSAERQTETMTRQAETTTTAARTSEVSTTRASETTAASTAAAPTSTAAATTAAPETTTAAATEPATTAAAGIDTSAYDDMILLAAIAQVEAGYNYDSCLAVCNVVLNRTRSSSYPNSVHDVIYQSGQFAGTGAGGMLERILLAGPASTPMQAAAAALAGTNNIGDFVHFCSDSYASSIGYPFSEYVVVGGNCFYKR